MFKIMSTKDKCGPTVSPGLHVLRETDPLNMSRYRKVLGEGQIWEADWADHR